MRRGMDIANASINVTQLITLLGVLWGAADVYFSMKNSNQVMHDQLGEVNARLKALESRP